MTVKTTGAELKSFYSDETFWMKGVWHEDERITINGIVLTGAVDVDSILDADVVTIKDGYMANEKYEKLGTFENFFKKWRKQQTMIFLSVEIPVEKVDAISQAIIAAGGKVRK